MVQSGRGNPVCRHAALQSNLSLQLYFTSLPGTHADGSREVAGCRGCPAVQHELWPARPHSTPAAVVLRSPPRVPWYGAVWDISRTPSPRHGSEKSSTRWVRSWREPSNALEAVQYVSDHQGRGAKPPTVTARQMKQQSICCLRWLPTLMLTSGLSAGVAGAARDSSVERPAVAIPIKPTAAATMPSGSTAAWRRRHQSRLTDRLDVDSHVEWRGPQACFATRKSPCSVSARHQPQPDVRELREVGSHRASLDSFRAQSETPTVRGPPSAATCTKRCNGPCRSGAPKSCSWLAVTTQAHACMDHCRDRFALGNVPARSSAQVSTTPTRQCLSAWAQRNRSGKHQGPGQASQRGKGSTRWMTPCAWLQIKGGPKAGGQRHQPAGGRPRDRPTTCATK